MKTAVVFGLMGFGFLLLVLGLSWPRMFPGTSAWTLEKETRLSEVSDRMHLLSFTVGKAEARPNMHGGPDVAKAKAELEALKKENAELTAQFRGIENRRDLTSTVLKYSGISLAVLGVIGWYAVNQSR
jgi:hypothetical protein